MLLFYYMYLFTTHGGFRYVCILYYLAFLFCLDEWNCEFRFVLSNSLGHRNHEKGLGVENTLQTGKGVWNPSDHAYKYTHMHTRALNVRTHLGPCVCMPSSWNTLFEFFHYKIAVKGFQTFIKHVLSTGMILNGSLIAEFTSLEISMWINKLNLNFKDALIPLGLSCISFFH